MSTRICVCTCTSAQVTCLSFLWLAGVFLFSACCFLLWLGLLPAIFFFVYNILLLPFWLALISVAVGNGKAMRMAATAAALKSKVQVNDKRKTPIKQSHFTRPYNSYSPKTLIKCPLWGLNPWPLAHKTNALTTELKGRMPHIFKMLAWQRAFLLSCPMYIIVKLLSQRALCNGALNQGLSSICAATSARLMWFFWFQFHFLAPAPQPQCMEKCCGSFREGAEWWYPLECQICSYKQSESQGFE